jgi:hypothetical protein
MHKGLRYLLYTPVYVYKVHLPFPYALRTTEMLVVWPFDISFWQVSCIVTWSTKQL